MKKKICAIISCLMVLAVTCTMITPTTIMGILGRGETMVAEYNGAEDYPFKNNQADAQDGSDAGYKNPTIDRLMSIYTNITNRTKLAVTSEYKYSMPFVIAKKYWDKYTGIDMTTSLATHVDADTVVDVGDGMMSYIVDDFNPDDVESLIEFGKQSEEKGMNFMLFMTPFKLDKTAKIQSGIYGNYSDEIEDKYVKMVEDAGINVVCVSDYIESEGLDRRSMFFKTDHHWTPQAALWANKLMCNYLNENMDFDIDTSIFDEENYDITYLDEEWLGTAGKKVTTAYCETEPFPVVVPKYETDVTAFVSKLNKTISGPVEDVLLEWEQLEEPDIYSRRNYDFYAYGDIALISVHNNKVNDGRRVLMVKRSYADAMIPSFAATVENLDVIDLRAFKGSLQTYIEKTKPDTIIMVYGVGEVIGEGTYDFR